MQTATPHLTRSMILIGLSGVILAVVIFSFTEDVVWTVVPLLLVVAAVRRLMHQGATR